MRFLVLGSLEAWVDGRELGLGAGRQRALLAFLVLHMGETVSVDRIVDALWAEQPPASAAKVVHGYVSQLRRALSPEVIVTNGSGYMLQAVDTDAAAFERLVEQARTRETAQAAANLRAALALWRGRPYGDVEYESWAQAEIARLEELRLTALEEKLDAEMRLGEALRVLPELEGLIASHPRREGLRVLHMLALYRTGRQAEALESYAVARSALVDELGLEPGPELQGLQRRILAQDPELGTVARSRRLVTRRRARGLLVMGALVATAALAAGIVELNRGGAAPVVGDSLIQVDPASAHARLQVTFAAPQSTIASGDGIVWVLNSDAGTMTSIAAATRQVLATFSVGQRPVDVVFAKGAFWVLTGGFQPAPDQAGVAVAPALTSYDPRSHTVVESFPIPDFPKGAVFFYTRHQPGEHELAYGAGSLWLANAPTIDSSIFRIDPAGGRLQAHITDIDAGSIVFADGALWTVDLDNLPHHLQRIDPATNRVDLRVSVPAVGVSSFALVHGVAWVPDFYTGDLWRITPGPPAVDRAIPVGIGAANIAASNGAVWVGNQVLDTLTRVDPVTGTARTLHVPAPEAIAPSLSGPFVATGAVPVGNALPASSCAPIVYPPAGSPRFILASDFDFRGGQEGAVAMQSAVLAVLRAHGFRAGRYTIGYQSCDDSTGVAGLFDIGKCTVNATLFAKTTRVIGVVGPANSGCATVEIPVLETARPGPLALISPTSNYDILTHTTPGQPPDTLNHLYPLGVRNFVHVLPSYPTEVAGAALLAQKLKIRRIAIADDGDQGQTPANIAWFEYSARRLDINTTVVNWHLPPTKIATAIARLRAVHADALFVAKGFPFDPKALFNALRKSFGAGYTIIGSDYVWPGDLWNAAGADAAGTYVALSGLPNSSLPLAGRRLLRELTQTGPSQTAAYAGAAAAALLDAIAHSNGTRGSVLHELFRTNIRNSPVGNLRFAADGDPARAPVTILRVVAHGTIPERAFAHATLDRILMPRTGIIHP